MAFSADDFLAQLLALLPQGEAWPRSYDALPASVLDGCAPEFARVQGRADDLLKEMDPSQTTEMLDEWEAVNGLPDACMPALTTIATRRAALLARLQESQGHNNDDYEAIAIALGHALTTAHRRPYLSFRAGVSRAGDRIQGDEWAHTWILAYMTGLIASPNALDTWTTTNTSVVTNVSGAPDATATADRIVFGTPGSVSKPLAPAPVTGQFDVWLSTETGQRQVLIELVSTSAVVAATITVDIDTYWKHVTLRGEHATGIATVRMSSVAGAYNVRAWGAQAGAVDKALECGIATVAQAHTLPIYRVIGSYVPTPD